MLSSLKSIYTIAPVTLGSFLVLFLFGCGGQPSPRGAGPDVAAADGGDSTNGVPGNPVPPANDGAKRGGFLTPRPDIPVPPTPRNDKPAPQPKAPRGPLEFRQPTDDDWFVGTWLTRDGRVEIIHANGFIEWKSGISVQRSRIAVAELEADEIIVRRGVEGGQQSFRMLHQIDDTTLASDTWLPNLSLRTVPLRDNNEWRKAINEVVRDGELTPRVMKADAPPNALKIGDGVLTPAIAMKPWPPLELMPPDDAIIRYEPLQDPFEARLILDPPGPGLPNQCRFQYSANGRWAAAVAQDGLNGNFWLGIWNLNEKSVYGLFRVFGRNAPALAFSDDGSALAIKVGQQVLVYEASNLGEPWFVPVIAGAFGVSPALSPDGQLLAFHSDNGFQIWSLADRTLLQSLDFKTLSAQKIGVNVTRDMKFLDDGSVLALLQPSPGDRVAYAYSSSEDWGQFFNFPQSTRFFNGVLYSERAKKQTIYQIDGTKLVAEERSLEIARGSRVKGFTPRYAIQSVLGFGGFTGKGGTFFVDRVTGEKVELERDRACSTPIVSPVHQHVVAYHALDNAIEVWSLANAEPVFRYEVNKEFCELAKMVLGSWRFAGPKTVAIGVEQGNTLLFSIAAAKVETNPIPPQQPETERIDWLWEAGKSREIPKVTARTAQRKDFLILAAVELDKFAEKATRMKRAYTNPKTGSQKLDAIRVLGQLLPSRTELELADEVATLEALDWIRANELKNQLESANSRLKTRGLESITTVEEQTLQQLVQQTKWPE